MNFNPDSTPYWVSLPLMLLAVAGIGWNISINLKHKVTKENYRIVRGGRVTDFDKHRCPPRPNRLDFLPSTTIIMECGHAWTLSPDYFKTSQKWLRDPKHDHPALKHLHEDCA